MKLKELHIYGYGKLENKHYTLSDLQLFYGENEAGKSTIMSFIHSILFGFPTKQQSLLRYVPKSSTEYGGKILCQTEEQGVVSIERIKGKAAGDVTVQFEDGRVEGEETLQQLLGKMDRSTYQNIFSFNLDGLQNIQRLKKEELNQYLFTAGSTGTDLLLKLSQDWQKERELLFKKSGRKPKINVVLSQLKDLEKQVKEGKEKNDQYLPLIARRGSLESDISAMERKKELLSEKRENLISVNENWDTLVQFYDVENRLSVLNDLDFPPNGLERMNELKIEERQTSAYLETLKSKQKNLQEKLESNDLDLTLSEDIPYMEKLLSQQSSYLKWKEESSERSRELRMVQSKISDTIRELGLQIDMENIPSLNTSLMMSENIQQALDHQTKLLHEQESLDKLQEEEMEELQAIEKKCENLEKRLMEEDEYQELQRKVKALTGRHSTKEQMEWVNLQVKEAEENYSRKKASYSYQMLISGGALLIAMGFGLWGMFSGNWIMAGMSLLVMMAVGGTIFQSRKNVRKETLTLQKLKARAKEIQPENTGTLDTAEQSLSEQMEFRNEWKQRVLSLEEQELKMQKLHERKEELEKAIVQGEGRIERLKRELYLPSDFHWKWLRDAFAKMKELVSSYETCTHLSDEVAYSGEKVKEFTEECRDWFHRHSLLFTTVEEALLQLKRMLQDLEKRQLVVESIAAELEPLSLDIEKHSIEVGKIRHDVHDLIHVTGCSGEMEFREKALKVQERNELWSQYRGMKTRLTKKTLDTFLEFPSLEESRRESSRVLQSIDELSKELSAQQKELASLSYEIKTLEEGKSYSTILQEFQSKKAEVAELAFEWSKYTLADVSLKRTMELYQKTKMPKVIELAEENFRELTEGHYQRIFLLDDEMIKVERKDGTIFHAIELSQGTKEQLFISIRFALIQSIGDKYPLPVLIDDGVVNFDLARTKAFLSLLRKVARDHQVLFFTCHPHIKQSFTDDEMIVLKRKESIRTS
ncbi:AAA family ATPase [Rossellomorea vietnamensis]|uniref:ATP-binding protein n=1 Tax=Rossellomorea vietnamensis TaxID=218284 RepID=UPI003D2D1683